MTISYKEQKLDGVILIKPKFLYDNFGYKLETFRKNDFIKHKIDFNFNYEMYIYSKRGILKGLYYSKNLQPQSFIASCSKGNANFVVVDIKRNSPTFGKYIRVELSEENRHLLYVPDGCAFGYVALSTHCEMSFKANNEQLFSNDFGIIWNDKDINIDWGIKFKPTLSLEDEKFDSLKEAFYKY